MQSKVSPLPLCDRLSEHVAAVVTYLGYPGARVVLVMQEQAVLATCFGPFLMEDRRHFSGFPEHWDGLAGAQLVVVAR